MAILLRRCAPAIAAAAFLVLAGRAGATIVPRLDLDELTSSSTAIVHGRVVRHWSEWDASHRYIWTNYTLAVSETLKGRSVTTLTVSEPGGTVGRDSLAVAGAPQYADQEEVLLFLLRAPNGRLRATGWMQGKFTVDRSSDGTAYIRTNLDEISLAAAPGSTVPAASRSSLATERARGRVSGSVEAGSASPLLRLNGMELGAFKHLIRTRLQRLEVTR